MRRLMVLLLVASVVVAGLTLGEVPAAQAAPGKVSKVLGLVLPDQVRPGQVARDRFRVTGPKRRPVVLQHRLPGQRWQTGQRARTTSRGIALVRISVVRSGGRWVWKARLQDKRWTVVARTSGTVHEFRVRVPRRAPFRPASSTAERVKVVTPPSPLPPRDPGTPTSPPPPPPLATVVGSAVVQAQRGSTVLVPPPAPLTATSTVTSGSAVPGLSWGRSESGLVRIDAAMGAGEDTNTAVVRGNGCQGSKCGVPYELAVKITVTTPQVPASRPVDDVAVPSADRVAAGRTLEQGVAVELQDEVVVVLGNASEPGSRAQADVVAAEVGAVVAGGLERLGLYQFRWIAPGDIGTRIAELAALPGVEGVDRSLIVPDLTASIRMPPGDWSDGDGDGEDATWPFLAMNAPAAWSRVDSVHVPVGVVDGDGVVDRGHPDLDVFMTTHPFDAAVGTGAHATHVAGLACMRANGTGLVGAAWGCPIITDAVETTGDSGYALLTAVVAAHRVVDAGARVVNMSLGFTLETQCADQGAASWLDQLISGVHGGTAAGFRRLAERDGKDVVFTLSAGNNCKPGTSSPFAAAADLPNVITVSSIDSDGELSSFSDWGGEVAAGGGFAVPPTTNSSGDPVYGTGVWSSLPGGKYGMQVGTSMAAPLVAGVAAMVRQANPQLTAAEVGDCITTTAGTSTGRASVISQDPVVPGFASGPQIAGSISIPVVDAGAAVTCGRDGIETLLVSQAPDGSPADGESLEPTVTADGRYVAFSSYASNLVAGDTNGESDVFVRDTTTGWTTRVSVASDGSQTNARASSGAARISGDGRFVAFVSDAWSLVPGDFNGASDVFVHDRQTGQTSRVSVGTGGTSANGDSGTPAISADGRFVAFSSEASNLASGDDNGVPDVFVYERETGQTHRVSNSPGSDVDAWIYGVAISADGRYVAYDTLAPMVPEDTNNTRDVFVHDRQTGRTSIATLTSHGTQAGGNTPAISGDGRYVSFTSGLSTVVPGDTNGRSDVFVHDRLSGETRRISGGSEQPIGEAHSCGHALSHDGRYVTYYLVGDDPSLPGGPDDGEGVYVHDQQTGVTTRVSTDHTREPFLSECPAISGDGRVIVFDSDDPEIVPGGSWQYDIYLSRVR